MLNITTKMTVFTLGLILGGSVVRANPLVEILDDFNSGDITVNTTVTSTYGDIVPGVFGDNRAILLTKANETSATSIAVGSGVLTCTLTDLTDGTGSGDYAVVSYGGLSTARDFSGYDAFSIMVNSAPQNAGQLDLVLFYFGSPTHTYGVRTQVALPTSGSVVIPFSSFVAPADFPPIDLTQVNDLMLEFRGTQLIQGTYVLDNFEAITIPEPTTLGLLALGAVGLIGRKQK